MKNYIKQEPAYDVSGGDKNFDSFEFKGDKAIICQLHQSSLNQTDHKLRLQTSLDNVNFNDALDESGNQIEITISNSLATSALFKYDFTAKYCRFQFVEGTTGTGTIDELDIMTE